MYIYKAGLVGGGTMGAEIAQVISYSGLPVVIMDINRDTVEKTLTTVRKIYDKRVEKGKMTDSELDQKMALITGVTSLDEFKDVDIVIEAIPEDIELKREVFKKLDIVCQDSTILATNTSSLSISDIASATRRPDKVFGFHFFNPAHVMKLIEVIPGLQTSDETIDGAISFAESLRKIPIKVKECSGFIVNRLLMPYLNEAVFVLQEGTSTAMEIDRVMTEIGMPMGPFALADMIGLDICYKVAEVLYSSYGERMKPSPLLKEFYENGKHGVKSKSGFYEYGDERGMSAEELILKTREEHPLPKGTFSPTRLILPMINEATTAIQENVASASDIDIAMLTGAGFPQGLGGPLHYADSVGIDNTLSQLIEHYQKYGVRFFPCPLLKRMVGANYLGKNSKKGFFDYP